MRDMNTIERIRKLVFGLTQAEFATVAGVRQSTVSRWENGVPLSHREMTAIRAAAAKREIAWSDAWFFEPAPDLVSARAEAEGAAA